jgi:lipopolysaccharide biosynthesis regulator YciM
MIDKNQFEVFKSKVDVLLKHYNAGNYIHVLQETERLNKKYPENSFLFNLSGSCLQKIGRLEDSKKFFNFAIKIEKNNLAAINNLGNSHKLLYEFDEAEDCFIKILNKNPNHIQSTINLGNLYYEQNKLNEAIKLFDKALELDSDLILAHYNAGLTHQSLGNTEKAMFHYNKILNLNPKMTIADRQMNRMIKYTDNNDHFKSMKERLNNLDLNQNQKIDINFALGKAYEDLKDYGNSYLHLKNGNDLKYELVKEYSMKDINLSQDLLKKLENTKLSSNEMSKNEKKMIFIIGLPRSGTSLVEQILASHSKIYGCGELTILELLIKKYLTRENKFEKSKLENIDNFKTINNVFNRHIQRFHNGNKLIFTDKTPQNFMWIGIIQSIFPKAKFVHCERNSKDNCLSIYKNLFDGDINWSYNTDTIIQYYKHYKKVMSYWIKDYASSIYTIQYENLISSAEAKIREILNFCDIEFEQNCIEFYNNKRPIKTVSINQARQPIYKSSINNNQNFEKYLSNFFDQLN